MKLIPFTRPQRLKIIFFVLAALLGLSTLAVIARVRRSAGAAEQPPLPDASSTAQQARRSRGRNLSLQPEALKLGRRLGRRFREAGREVSVLSGTLAFGGESRSLIIRRAQGETGESLEVALGGGGAPHTWDDRGGARRSGRAAEGEERLLVERLALDSPDQFMLAQLRGASYYTVARNVRPEEAGGSDDYAGPLWDVVRVSEPGASENRPQSPWRLYYVNRSTGLIDRVVSQEGGETVTAEMSGWVERGGESIPTHITWRRNGSTVMELTLNNMSHGPRQ
jgi:hypothetical protein